MRLKCLIGFNVLPFVFLLISLVVVSGCITARVSIKPELMAETGLVVARFTSNVIMPGTKYSLNYNEEARIFGSAVISGETYPHVVEDNRLVMQLKPGKYRLEKIYTSTRYGHGTRYFNIAFDVVAGRVTNLGGVLLYFLGDASHNTWTKSSVHKGKTFYVNNDEDMRDYLKTKFPAAYSTLKSEVFVPSDEYYLDKDAIKAMQYRLLSDVLKKAPQGKYAATIFGVVGRFEKSSTDVVKTIELTETGTYEAITKIAYNKKRFACLVPGHAKNYRLFIFDGQKLEKKPVAGIDDTYGVELVGDKGVVLYNKSLLIQSSVDNGSSWEKYDKAILDKPIPTTTYVWRGVRSVNSKKGYFIHTTSKDSTLLYRDYGHVNNYIKIDPPTAGYKFRGLVETSKGIFSFPNKSEWSKSTFYFLPRGSVDWEKRECPSAYCDAIEADDASVTIQCDNKYWQSKDLGLTWRLKQ